MSKISIRQVKEEDRDWIKKLTKETFGSEFVFDAGRKKYPHKLPGFIVYEDRQRIGLVTYEALNKDCEVVSIESLVSGKGVGSLLLEEVNKEAKKQGCQRLWLITTNDNLSALAFYQKRGFSLVKIYKDAVTKTRETVKPEVPLFGENGIPIRDEIELEIIL